MCSSQSRFGNTSSGTVLNVYADTSFLVSVYLTDGNSPKAIDILQALDDALPISDFHLMEFQNALSLAVFQKRITKDQSAHVESDFKDDFSVGRLYSCSLNWQAAFRFARELAKSETPIIGTRSLDILHVASALLIGSDEFLTFDTRQRSMADRMGLKTS